MSPEASISTIRALRSSPPTVLGQGQRVGEPVKQTPEVAAKVAAEVAAEVADESLPSDAERNPALGEAVSRLNDAVQALSRKLQFRIDSQSNRVVITVIDRETDEIIRQIPAEEALAMANHIEQAGGLIVRGQA